MSYQFYPQPKLSRSKHFVLPAIGIIVGLAAIAYLWLTRGGWF